MFPASCCCWVMPYMCWCAVKKLLKHPRVVSTTHWAKLIGIWRLCLRMLTELAFNWRPCFSIIEHQFLCLIVKRYPMCRKLKQLWCLPASGCLVLVESDQNVTAPESGNLCMQWTEISHSQPYATAWSFNACISVDFSACPAHAMMPRRWHEMMRAVSLSVFNALNFTVYTLKCQCTIPRDTSVAQYHTQSVRNLLPDTSAAFLL